jgi:hypothetical protein
MRKALIPAFLLVVAAIVLGSTLFREQLVNAATTPFQNVVVQNTSTNPVPVKEVGTSTTSVTGTVGIDSTQNTVKLDSTGNTVKIAPPGPVAEHCLNVVGFGSQSVPNDGNEHTLCSDDFYVTDINLTGMDDNMVLHLLYNGNTVLAVSGSTKGASDSYQFDLSHPIHIDTVEANCDNTSTDCQFTMTLLGNSTGT